VLWQFTLILPCVSLFVEHSKKCGLPIYDVQVRMRDPVIAADGQTYERSAIQGWLAAMGSGPPRSPVTGQPMPTAALLPNLAIRELLQRCL